METRDENDVRRYPERGSLNPPKRPISFSSLRSRRSKTIASLQVFTFPSLLPRAYFALLTRTKYPCPSLWNAYHAGYLFSVLTFGIRLECYGRGRRGTPYNGLYEEAPPERRTFFRVQVYERVEISVY